MLPKISLLLVIFLVLEVAVAPPVDQKKTDKEDKKKEEKVELDDFGLEYGRYLQQVVQALEEDKEFAKKLENISAEEISSGRIAKELEFVKHNVRSRLDELKRIEVDRLRKLLQEQLERTELGLYRDEEGHLLNSPDGRRWRTIPNHKSGLEGGVGDGNFWLGWQSFCLFHPPLCFHPMFCSLGSTNSRWFVKVVECFSIFALCNRYQILSKLLLLLLLTACRFLAALSPFKFKKNKSLRTKFVNGNYKGRRS